MKPRRFTTLLLLLLATCNDTTAADCDYRTLNRLLPTLLLQEKKLPNIGFVLSSVGAVLLSIGAVLSSVDAVLTLVAAKEHF